MFFYRWCPGPDKSGKSAFLANSSSPLLIHFKPEALCETSPDFLLQNSLPQAQLHSVQIPSRTLITWFCYYLLTILFFPWDCGSLNSMSHFSLYFQDTGRRAGIQPALPMQTCWMRVEVLYICQFHSHAISVSWALLFPSSVLPVRKRKLENV